MRSFEDMSDEEFSAQLCEPVALLASFIRGTGYPVVDDYRKQLVELDRHCAEPVAA